MTEPPVKRQRMAQIRREHKRYARKLPKPGSADATIQYSINEMLSSERVSQLLANGFEYDAPFERFTLVQADITALSTHGDGLAVCDNLAWLLVIPFTLPGERVLARIHRNERLHSHAEMVKIISEASEKDRIRDSNLVRCPYFGLCSGCQYQEIPYEKQLEIKQSIVRRAFLLEKGIPANAVPTIQPTLPSPLQYAYRTKLTPHFNTPSINDRRDDGPLIAIGFEEKGRKRIVDIEQCPIATTEVNEGLQRERERVKGAIKNYKRGATLLLRQSWPTSPGADSRMYCETNHQSIVRERVGRFQFEFTAGSFFQNNNSILPELVGYVGDEVGIDVDSKRYLVDAYCGSGLFSISLADRFTYVQGVEISAESVNFARRNAALNNLSNVDFIEGKAEAVFASIEFPAAQTTVIVDPPRRGCDQDFLSQLAAFRPLMICYISCSVHTQAPDVSYLMLRGGYQIRSIRGIDLFPQTHHVESVAVLTRNDEVSNPVKGAVTSS